MGKLLQYGPPARAGLAEAADEKLRLIWNSSMSYRKKLHVFQSLFISMLVYGLDSLALTSKQIRRVDGIYFRFRRRMVGMKASFLLTSH